MGHRFRDWLRCPVCDSDDERLDESAVGAGADIGVLTHRTDVVLECYRCGHIAEFTLGRDVPFANVDQSAIRGGTDDRTTES